MSAIGSCPERQLPLQNYGKPTFVQPTAQGQLLCSIGKGRYGGKVVVSGHSCDTSKHGHFAQIGSYGRLLWGRLGPCGDNVVFGRRANCWRT